ncbi:MarR family transcriptional regulator [Steroidobacter sp. S1-65]|uniref:MarR family transcriptional regulator n=1 Tax=Steroidobacter gossypii TaxID=2805490 RepID=A0ABS1WXR8_9GAMM|nr:helix-turn-helix domain-containing GNAT family N-acetyltransferase [Steroidobacter gossypii]MBM0105766.1 MarR family transcriptional regulator [Steroidobacter gossypii]
MSAAIDSIISDVRQFNRFYTKTIGVLGEGMLGCGYSLSEVRVLYEIANGENVMAADLVRTLGMDFGYVSRILALFEKRGFLKRQRSDTDARKSLLILTTRGRKAFEALNQQARDEIAKLLEPLATHQQLQLQANLRQVQSLLDPAERSTQVKLRTHRAGDMGWIIQRHGALYEKEYGFNADFEALVAEICAKFLREFDATKERCWIAELGDAPVGTIMLVRGAEGVAKLRLLLVEDSARGLGVGRMLVQACIQFAREAGYDAITLWTQSNLSAARKLYLSAGFKLEHSEPHVSFGQSLVGETWTLPLK